MKVLSPERMAKYDAYSIQGWGIPSAVLMENAGRTTYRLMSEDYLGGDVRRIVILCGRGNNGGDGFVIGRYALRDGYQVKVFLLGRPADLRGDALLNHNLFRSLGGHVEEVGDDMGPVTLALKHAHVVVDAIFGTGLSKPVEGREKAVVDAVNDLGRTVIAVDIPSGIDGRTGAVLGSAIRAAHTYTFAYPKTGQLVFPGAHHAGRLTVIDISVPREAEAELGYDGEAVDCEMAAGLFRPRLPWGHKGSYGHAAVMAGSPGKTGAAHMTSLAALKIGAGLVTLLTPATLNPIMEVKLTEVMTQPVADGGSGFFGMAARDEVLSSIADKDVVVIGPGLSQDPGTSELVRCIYGETDKPLVVDADGINAFAGHLDALGRHKNEVVLTPHPGELARLLGTTPAKVNADRLGTGRAFAGEHGVILVLKGARTLTFTPGGEVFINLTGNAALAKGGSGDILTGFIGGLVSQGYPPLEAAITGVFLHGYMADRWVEFGGNEMDLLAGDLLDGLGSVISEIGRGEGRVYIEKSL